tara:strand:- start:397 stop:1074 length:678 start_codon:yes stop_codon:yes gene_type:complete
MSTEPLLLLAGTSAVALAPRLSASGYTTVDWLSAGVTSSCGVAGDEPLAAVLGADQIDLIAELRQRFGAMTILLDLEQDSVEARANALRCGADDFWLSGLGPSDLLLRLRLHRTIQAREGRRPQQLQLQDLSLDPVTRQVRRAGRELALTAREYALLVVMMKRPGHVFSREQLMREVWNDETANSNVVEVYVRYLRQKLEGQGQSRLLLTVRGRGYSLGPVAAES